MILLMFRSSVWGEDLLARLRIRSIIRFARLVSLTMRSMACRASSRIRRLSSEPEQASVAVYRCGRERLIDLVRNRRSQFSQSRYARDVRKLSPRLMCHHLCRLEFAKRERSRLQ